MKKSTVRITIILFVVLIGVVALYAFLLGKAKRERDEATMTPVQSVLNKNLDYDYPATVKSVIEYYTELEKCLYNEDCTDGELENLGMQARKLYDQELLDNNELTTYLTKLKEDIKSFRGSKRTISSVSVAGAANVDYFSEDGYEFARIHCGYSVKESNGLVQSEGRVYLLRRDENKQWKIYGWDSADNVHVGEEE